MARTLTGGSGRKWDIAKDRFTARLESNYWETVKDGKGKKGKPKKARFLQFRSVTGDIIVRNSTTLWDRWLDGDKETKSPALLKSGDVIRIKSIEEDKSGRNRFYNFTVDILEKQEIPATLRK